MLDSFIVKNQKSIGLASCEKVPPIMIIAGINGAGKSTLLDAIKHKNGEINFSGKFIYIPPHRIWSKQVIEAQRLWNARKTYSDATSGDTLSSVEGIRINSSDRTADSSDESTKFIKFSLGQIEIQRQNAITAIYDAKSNQPFPDIYEPLKELTRTLLPHLEFYKVNLENRQDIKCLWKRADGIDLSVGTPIEVDIDNLSSGEKAILTLFFSFIEHMIEETLKTISDISHTESKTDLIVLIDEPELHLHPVLEGRVLDYLRKLVSEGNTQFIITTHSPALLNNATSEELFLLSPKTSANENQLRRLVEENDKLEALRIICGETYPFTASKNILCIEGESPSDTPKKPTDKKLLEIFCPEITKNVVVPLGGKFNVIDGAKRLRENMPQSINKINVFALVDKDQDSSIDEDWVFRLPVCMIENLLLKPDAINVIIEKYRELIKLKDASEIESQLKEIASSLREDEIRVRIKRKIKPINEMIDGTSVDELKNNLQTLINNFSKKLPTDQELNIIVEESKNEVEKIILDKKEMDLFRGKSILKKFYEKWIKASGFSYHVFCLELAEEIAKNPQNTEQLNKLIKKINSK